MGQAEAGAGEPPAVDPDEQREVTGVVAAGDGEVTEPSGGDHGTPATPDAAADAEAREATDATEAEPTEPTVAAEAVAPPGGGGDAAPKPAPHEPAPGRSADAASAPELPEPDPADQPEVVVPDPTLAAILVRLDDLTVTVARLDDRLAERDRLAARDRDLVDKLHAENQRLRSGEVFQAIAPVARDLVRLRDQLLRLDAASPEPGKGDAALIEPQLLGILARLGVEPYAPEPGDGFDAALHQGVGRTTTADAALDGRVSVVRREGFTAPDGRPLRAAEVEVWRHVPPDPTADPGAPGGS